MIRIASSVILDPSKELSKQICIVEPFSFRDIRSQSYSSWVRYSKFVVAIFMLQPLILSSIGLTQRKQPPQAICDSEHQVL